MSSVSSWRLEALSSFALYICIMLCLRVCVVPFILARLDALSSPILVPLIIIFYHLLPFIIKSRILQVVCPADSIMSLLSYNCFLIFSLIILHSHLLCCTLAVIAPSFPGSVWSFLLEVVTRPADFASNMYGFGTPKNKNKIKYSRLCFYLDHLCSLGLRKYGLLLSFPLLEGLFFEFSMTSTQSARVLEFPTSFSTLLFRILDGQPSRGRKINYKKPHQVQLDSSPTRSDSCCLFPSSILFTLPLFSFFIVCLFTHEFLNIYSLPLNSNFDFLAIYSGFFYLCLYMWTLPFYIWQPKVHTKMHKELGYFIINGHTFLLFLWAVYEFGGGSGRLYIRGYQLESSELFKKCHWEQPQGQLGTVPPYLGSWHTAKYYLAQPKLLTNQHQKNSASAIIDHEKSQLKFISSLIGPKRFLVNKKLVLKRVDFWKPVNYIIVDLMDDFNASFMENIGLLEIEANKVKACVMIL
ncbi:hypothetical protein VP01_1481g2 [Puccinia sorghi]|uniref:Uncharacterized protein n=1 Tax=Puccinia sorghi TaxID=27349 RepID=A0A0L6VJH1_9BASI|nr:hypothetical protein VP01_1481g2 [Puccinia sorghi]